VTGSAPFSPDFPTTVGAIERTLAAGGAFVTRLISTGMGLVYSTFLGGGSASGIALDAAGNAYVTGQVSSASSGFPTTPGAYNQNLSTVEVAIFAAKIAPGPPACEVAGLSAGPPAQLKVAVHADRGLSTLAVTSASNATVALPSLTPGTTNTLQISATKINQTLGSTVTLKATDAAGTGATCDPAIVTVGRGPGERPSRCSTTSLWAKATSRWSTAGPASTDYASRSTATSSSSRTWWAARPKRWISPQPCGEEPGTPWWWSPTDRGTAAPRSWSATCGVVIDRQRSAARLRRPGVDVDEQRVRDGVVYVSSRRAAHDFDRVDRVPSCRWDGLGGNGLVATEAWPKVAWTRWNGPPPRSRAWMAWACGAPVGRPGTPGVAFQTGAIGCAADRRDWLCCRPARLVVLQTDALDRRGVHVTTS
jgi:hypothetical protein